MKENLTTKILLKNNTHLISLTNWFLVTLVVKLISQKGLGAFSATIDFGGSTG